MSRRAIWLSGLAFSIAFWIAVGITVAYAAPATHKPLQLEAIEPTVAPKPIIIKCPCVVTVQDGALSVDPGAVLSLSGPDLAIQSGHFSSDSPAIIQNVTPKPDRER